MSPSRTGFRGRRKLYLVITAGYDSLLCATTTEDRMGGTEITRKQYDWRHLRDASDCMDEERLGANSASSEAWLLIASIRLIARV